LIAALGKRDRFFRDYFEKAYSGGSLFDRITTDPDYEMLFIFWHASTLAPKVMRPAIYDYVTITTFL
jgi:hypothetical protein